MITQQQFKEMTGATDARVKMYYLPLTSAMEKYGITTPLSICAFIANAVHETGAFKWMEEIASGDAYDTRTDLGNTKEVDGDGRKYKGRGIFQITGKTNYEKMGKELNYDFVKDPEALELPGAASMAACIYWNWRKLGPKAEKDDFLGVCIGINGKNRKTGLPNHWEERQALYYRAKRVMGLPI